MILYVMLYVILYIYMILRICNTMGDLTYDTIWYLTLCYIECDTAWPPDTLASSTPWSQTALVTPSGTPGRDFLQHTSEALGYHGDINNFWTLPPPPLGPDFWKEIHWNMCHENMESDTAGVQGWQIPSPQSIPTPFLEGSSHLMVRKPGEQVPDSWVILVTTGL
jgi:hypothetical protein